MRQLVLLYWGCVFLMYLSQIYYPVGTQLDGRQTGKHHFILRRSDVFMIATILWLTCFSFLRTSYNDTGNYIMYFRDSASVSEFISGGGLLDWAGNPLSMLYRCFIHDLTENYHVYFFFPAVLNSYAIVKLFKKHSVNLCFSMIIFMSLGTYVTYMASLKQCMALFFLMLSIPYAIDKKYLKFYLLVFVAVLFHAHSFTFLFLPFLLGKPWNKITWIIMFTALFSMATYDSTLGAFMEYAQSLGANVAEIEVFDDHSINSIRVLVYWVPALLALAFRKRLFEDSTKPENLFVNMSIVSAAILSIGLVEGGNLFGRMSANFEFAAALALPWMVKKLFTKKSAQIVAVVAAILYFGYFYFEFAIAKDFGSSYSAISLWQFILSLFG